MHYLHNEILASLESERMARETEQFHRRLEAAGLEPASVRRSLRDALGRIRHPRRSRLGAPRPA